MDTLYTLYRHNMASLTDNLPFPGSILIPSRNPMPIRSLKPLRISDSEQSTD